MDILEQGENGIGKFKNTIIMSEETIELYQYESTRRPNGLIYRMRELFDRRELTTWQFHEFRRMVRCFCDENEFAFDEKTEMIYKQRPIYDPSEKAEIAIDTK